MSRQQSPIQKKAFKLWCEMGRPRSSKAIAETLGVTNELIRKWKSYYNWVDEPDPRPGAPRGNRNAKSNKGGSGGPEKNDHAVKHGLFRKFLPDDPETLEIFDATADMSPLEMLWTSIRIAWTNIIRAQKIQHVSNKDEMIKELKKQKFEVVTKGRGKNKEIIPVVIEEEWNFQFAWDRQATGLNSQSAAMTNLTRMIKQYEDMLRAIPPDQVHEEQKLRIVKLKAEVKVLGDGGRGAQVQIIDDIKRGEGK